MGDDYGRPTDLPWGVKFPQGLPPSTAGNLSALFKIPMVAETPASTVLAVHPTQLYEVALMTIAFMVLWKWRLRAKPMGWIFGVYLIFAGMERFLVEILRAKDDRFLGPFTLAQATSIAVVLVGVAVMRRLSSGDDPAPGGYLTRAPSP